MANKRIIFTLLYNSGKFSLSRNFRLQEVGDANWLVKHYNFAKISHAIDELIILDVSRNKVNFDEFRLDVEKIASGCFVPLSLGGNVGTLQAAHKLFQIGADKIVINSSLHTNPDLISNLAKEFGQQSLVASVDLKRTSPSSFKVFIEQGSNALEISAKDFLSHVAQIGVGEIYLNSIDRDGTGQGFDLAMLDELSQPFPISVILAGGAGSWKHMYEGMRDPRVDAVATANLFNFIGNSLVETREELKKAGIELASWGTFDTGEIS